jgi:hypothetical protein
MNEIILANAALTLLEQLLPKIQQSVAKGDVTVEEQRAVHERYAALRATGDAAFSGPEWQIET